MKAADSEEAVKEFVKKYHPNPSFTQGPSNPGTYRGLIKGNSPARKSWWFQANLMEKTANLLDTRLHRFSLIVIDCRAEQLAKKCFQGMPGAQASRLCQVWEIPNQRQSKIAGVVYTALWSGSVLDSAARLVLELVPLGSFIDTELSMKDPKATN